MRDEVATLKYEFFLLLYIEVCRNVFMSFCKTLSPLPIGYVYTLHRWNSLGTLSWFNFYLGYALLYVISWALKFWFYYTYISIPLEKYLYLSASIFLVSAMHVFSQAMELGISLLSYAKHYLAENVQMQTLHLKRSVERIRCAHSARLSS